MRVFAQKLKGNRQVKSVGSTKSSQLLVRQGRNVRPIRHLQRTIGNQAVLRWLQAETGSPDTSSASGTSAGFAYGFSRMLTSPGARDSIQPKLKVNAPGDRCEQEADRIADEVLRWKMPEGDNKKLEVQERASQQAAGGGREVDEDLENRLSCSKGGGIPVSDQVRAFVEPRMQLDLSGIQIHSDHEAAEMSRKLEARAFTHHRDIYFGAGQYSPQSTTGKRLLVHELTHAIQQGASSSVGGQYVQRSAYQTAEQRGHSGNPINVAVQAVRNHYSAIGATWLTTHLVAGIIYAEGEINTDVTDVIGDMLGTADTVGPGQLSSAAIQQVDSSIPQAAHRQFEAQFGAAPETWREKAEHDQWAFFYTAGYLAWCMSEAARLFQAVDGADSHVPLGFAYYQGAFTRIRDLRRRIARERGIANTDVTWEMVEEAAGRGASRRLNPRERRVFEYAQLGAGRFDFEFQINRALESRTFYVPEGHVRVHCSANYTESGVAPGSGDSYYIQLLELRTTGQGTEFQSVRLVRHNRVRFRIGQRQVYEWTGLLRGSTYVIALTNENSNEISGQGEVEYLY